VNRQAAERTRAFALVAYAMLMLFVGTTLPTPLYRVYQQNFHFSSGILTLVFAIYVFTLLPSLLLFGRISDQIGRRPMLLAGVSLACLSAVLFTVCGGLGWLFAARALQGVATGITTGTATAALAELEPRTDVSRAALIASLANVGGAALGPLLGGLLAQYGPWPLVLPYLVYLALLTPLLQLGSIPETVTRSPQFVLRLTRPQIPNDIWAMFALAAAVSFTVWAATALFLTLAPSYVATLLHIDNLALGGGVVSLMLAASAAAQAILRGLPQRSAMLIGLLFLTAGLGGVVLAAPLGSASLVFGGAAITGMGQGLAYLGCLALLNQIAPQHQRGEVTSCFYIATYLGVALPVLGVGFGAQLVGLFVAVAAFASTIGAVSLLLMAGCWLVRFR
jgi:predicted MFS family arabinose efflux permease